MHTVDRYRSIGLFVVLAFVWGWSFPAIEVGLEHFPAVLFAAYRFDLAAVLLLGYLWHRGAAIRPRGRGDLIGIALGGAFIVAGSNAFLFIGQQYTTSGIASITFSLIPIVTAAAAAVILGSSGLDTRGRVGVVLGFIGVGMVAQPDPNALGEGMALGVAIILIGVIAASVGSVGINRIDVTISNLTLTAWTMAVGAVLLHVSSLAIGESQRLLVPSQEALVALAFLAIGPSVIGYAIYFDLLDSLGALQINLISYVVPIIATITGALVLGETITALTVTGFATIVAGFALMKRSALASAIATWRLR